jgi:hypothetical protein
MDMSIASKLLALLAVIAVLLLPAPCLRAGDRPGGAEKDGAWAAAIEKRVRDLQPTAAERRLDEIGWARDLREAERLAREHGRPIFLFTHDGRINTGRC